MNWTSETPTEEGYYWHRKHATDPLPMVLLVYWPIRVETEPVVDVDALEAQLANAVLMVQIYTDEDPVLLSEVGGDWYGPLEPPR